MPEGDILWRTAKRLHDALVGSPVIGADLRWPGASTIDVSGQQVTEVKAVGKHLLMRFSGGWTLHTHLRMDGFWYVHATSDFDTSGTHPARSLPSRMHGHDVRAVVMAPTWTCVGLQLGMLDVVATHDEHTLVGHLGPDILSDDFDSDIAVAKLRAHDDTVGAALMDQRNLAGIGTVWSSESLFLERVSPWSATSALSTAQLGAVVARARTLMVANTLHAIQSSTGVRVQGREMYVHARSGRPCRRCGHLVRVSSIGPAVHERPMFYCPTCQGGMAPTDQGRPARPLGSSRYRRR